MLPRILSFLIYNLFVLSYLYDQRYGSTGESVVVRNLSVEVFQDQEYIERKDAYKFLKLNISWLPPKSIKQPTSYSIIATGIPVKEKVNTAECPEGSYFYTLVGNKQHNVLLPEFNSLVDIPDLYIQPNCSYKVQVYANPRIKHIRSGSEIIYTVPECIGPACSCINTKSTLLIPKVNISQRKNEIAVYWNTIFNATDVQSYIISIGVPVLMSRKGLLVYNITKIGQVSTDKTMFLWNLKSNNEHVEIKDGYKIIVNAVNYHGCVEAEGSFIIHIVSSITKVRNQNIISHPAKWFIPIGIITGCILFIALSFILYCNHSFFMIWQNNNPIRIHTISKCKSQWTEKILQEQNILYTKCDMQEDYMEETDKLKTPFKSVKLIRELGCGQFGKVYLGHLNDTNNTLVAVKVSQQIDAMNDSETQQQFVNEIEIMRMAGNHPHLVSLIGYCIQPTKSVCILLEYMQGGDLLTYLHHQRNQSEKIVYHNQSTLNNLYKSTVSKTFYTTIFSTIMNKRNSYKSKQYINITDTYKGKSKDTKGDWVGKIKGCQFLKFATEIAMGMEHLETKGITHRDLAARNILLSTDLTVKISDFGLSRNGTYVIKNTEEKTRRLPIRWMSPETLYNRAFSSKSDIWSFGVVLWEITTLGDFPYANIQDDRLIHYIVHENGCLQRPNSVPSDIYKLMHSCWAKEPEDRPNFAQLLSELRILTSSDNTFRTISNPSYAFPLSNKLA